MKIACDRCEKVIDMDMGEEKRKILRLETGSGLHMNLCKECADGFWNYINQKNRQKRKGE